MARKPIPEQTQANIVLNSRRRCCLCFWLKGEDEVKKGQIAHLDWDNENNAESNLVFLCLDHHDEYDSTPSQSKGLRQPEVRRWRDELYKEMKYRFRSIKTKIAEVSLVGFRWEGPDDEFSGCFSVKNTGDVELRRMVIAFRLPAAVNGEIPPRKGTHNAGGGLQLVSDAFEPFAASEEVQDLFEPRGRVCLKSFFPFFVLMPGHSERFDALLFHGTMTRPGDSLDLEYRIDAEEMKTVTATLPISIPSNPGDLLPSVSK